MSEGLILGVIFAVILSIPCIFMYYIYVVMYKKSDRKAWDTTSKISPNIADTTAWPQDAVDDLKYMVHNIRIAPLNELKNMVKCAKMKYRYCTDLFNVVYKDKLINLGYESRQAPFAERESSTRRNWLCIFIVNTTLAFFIHLYNKMSVNDGGSYLNSKLFVFILFYSFATYIMYHCAYKKKGTVLLALNLFGFAVAFFMFLTSLHASSLDKVSEKIFGVSGVPSVFAFSVTCIAYISRIAFAFCCYRLYQINHEARGRKLLEHLDLQEDS